MVACWSEHPNDRPSAKDIQVLSGSLEYRHLMDVIEIGQREDFQQQPITAAVSYRESKTSRRVFLRKMIDLDNENENGDDEIGVPTADCWYIRQSKPDGPSSIVIVAYDQFNAVNQQVGSKMNRT